MGCGRLENGALLAAAEQAGFDALVTVDKRIRHQQNLAGRRIGIVVLPTQNMTVLREGLAVLRAAFVRAGQGTYEEFELPRPALVRRPPPEQGR